MKKLQKNFCLDFKMCTLLNASASPQLLDNMVICSPGITSSLEEFTELLLQILFKYQADAL